MLAKYFAQTPTKIKKGIIKIEKWQVHLKFFL
jgi:hypothetical protein